VEPRVLAQDAGQQRRARPRQAGDEMDAVLHESPGSATSTDVPGLLTGPAPRRKRSMRIQRGSRQALPGPHRRDPPVETLADFALCAMDFLSFVAWIGSSTYELQQ
jgi:hypothetical protein